MCWRTVVITGVRGSETWAKQTCARSRIEFCCTVLGPVPHDRKNLSSGLTRPRSSGPRSLRQERRRSTGVLRMCDAQIVALARTLHASPMHPAVPHGWAMDRACRPSVLFLACWSVLIIDVSGWNPERCERPKVRRARGAASGRPSGYGASGWNGLLVQAYIAELPSVDEPTRTGWVSH